MIEHCELCTREVGRYVDKLARIEFDGNQFNACEMCIDFLAADWTPDVPLTEVIYL